MPCKRFLLMIDRALESEGGFHAARDTDACDAHTPATPTPATPTPATLTPPTQTARSLVTEDLASVPTATPKLTVAPTPPPTGRVTIYYRSRTISVLALYLPLHEAHGDPIGVCN